MKKILSILLILVMLFSFVACEAAPNPGDEGPVMSKLSISSSYKGNKDGNFFDFTFNWKQDETYSATFTHDYDLYYAMDEMGPFEYCEPIEGYTSDETIYTLVPNEKQSFSINVDDKYEGLPSGYYRFVFKFDVSVDGGEVETQTASVDFEL